MEKADLQKKLARAVLAFQDSYLARDNSPVGLLCQVWLPEDSPAGGTELRTKGMPFCVAGMGDLLALFRCISCRFNFSADPARPDVLGAPGRVYVSGMPELSCNVQQYPREAYLRRAEAEQCRVQSSMLLPIFTLPLTGEPRPPAVGVIEVVQTSDDMAFLPVARLLAAVLLKCGLHTSAPADVQSRMPTAVTSLELPLRTGLLEEEGAGSGGPAPGSGDTSARDGGEEEEEDSEEAAPPPARGGRARRPGKSGKPGVKLTLADLQGQFGVGLKEAAATLGVCTTTLKRACRRHGIQRWPRRALQKVSRTLDEMERRGGMHGAMAGAVPMGALIHPTTGQLIAPGILPAAVQQLPVDSRWAALATMIPNLGPAGAGLQLPPGVAAAAGAAGPSPSDFSLDGVVTVGNGTGKKNLTVATGGTGPMWDQNAPAGTAAGAVRLATAPAPVTVVPSFLRPDLGDAQRKSFESPFSTGEEVSRGDGPVLALPSLGGGSLAMPNLSQLSVPSFMMPTSMMMAPGLFSSGMGTAAAAAGGGPAYPAAAPAPHLFQAAAPPAQVNSGPGEEGNAPKGAKDDVGLLDSTILELMLQEDTRGLVGATDDDLKRMFDSVGGKPGQPQPQG